MPEPDYMLDVPRRGVGWISANNRLHWSAEADRIATWRQVAGWAAKAAKLPALGPSRVVAELVMHPRRTARLDPGNYAPTAKAVVDGLLDARIWPDDNHAWVLGPDMRLSTERAATMQTEALRLLIWGRPCCEQAGCHHQEVADA